MLFGKTFTQRAESKLQESSALSKLSSPDWKEKNKKVHPSEYFSITKPSYTFDFIFCFIWRLDGLTTPTQL